MLSWSLQHRSRLRSDAQLCSGVFLGEEPQRRRNTLNSHQSPSRGLGEERSVYKTPNYCVLVLACGFWRWAKSTSSHVLFQAGKNTFFPPFRYLFEYIEEDDKRAWMILRN